MKKNVRRLLIIPARGESKRIKNKNIKKFHGKPIILYSIETALRSKLFSKIHISTESKKIVNTIKEKNLHYDFYRPKNLSGDRIGIFDVIKFVVKKFRDNSIIFNEVWCMTPCSPLIREKDLINASKILKKAPKKIVISVSEYQAPIEWAFKMNTSKNLSPLNIGSFKKRSQDLKKKYFDTGNFVGMKYNLLKSLKKNAKLDLLYKGLIIPKYRSVDIDDKNDWKLAEKYFKNLNLNNF